MRSSVAFPSRTRARRVLALGVLLWLNVGLEPCALAAMGSGSGPSSAPAPTETHCPHCPPASVSPVRAQDADGLQGAVASHRQSPAHAAAQADGCARSQTDCTVAGVAPEHREPTVKPSGEAVYLAERWTLLAPAPLARLEALWESRSAAGAGKPRRIHALFGVFLN